MVLSRSQLQRTIAGKYRELHFSPARSRRKAKMDIESGIANGLYLAYEDRLTLNVRTEEMELSIAQAKFATQ